MYISADDTIKFLADFLRIDAERRPWAEPWEKVKEISDGFLEKIIFAEEYPHKNALRLTLDSILNRIFALSRFPQLYNKHVICHVGRKEAFSTPLRAFSSRSCLFGVNVSIPSVCTAKSARAPEQKHFNFSGVYNPQGGVMPASVEEIQAKLDAISAKGIELRTMFSAITEELSDIPPHVALLDIPRYGLPQSLFLKSFLDIANDIIVSPSNSPLFFAAMEYVQQVRPGATIFVSAGQIDPQNALFRPFSRLRFVQGIPPVPEQPICNADFHFLFKRAIQSPLSWLTSRNEDLKNLYDLLTTDLIMNDANASLARDIGQLRQSISNSMQLINQHLNACFAARKNILQEAWCMDEGLASLWGDTALTDRNRYASLAINNWKLSEEFLDLLVVEKNLIETRSHVDAMRKAGYPLECVLTGALAAVLQATGGEAAPLDFDIVRQDRPLAHRLSIRLRAALGIDDVAAGRDHAARIECQYGEEWYVLGVWQESEGNPQAAKSFREALILGVREAGRHLYARLPFCSSPEERIKSQNFLVNALVPEACYELACERKRGPMFTGKALFHLYVAAAQLYEPALLAVAHQEFFKSRRKDRADSKKNLTNTRGLYAFLYEAGKLDTDGLCNFGTLLHEEGDFGRAHEVFSQCNAPFALRTLGRMYHYGDGVEIDLEMAIKYYTRAIAKGDTKAAQLCDKAQDQKSKKERKNTYDASRDYSRTSETTSRSGGGGGGGCFLTSTTCRVMGFPDDCDVLQAYRRYRDEILLQDAPGKDLVKQYYKIAPEIVDRIEAEPDPMSIYRSMWEQFLVPGYELLLEKRHEEARSLYIQLVTTLLNRFSMEISLEVPT